jgi:hypothetical protein
MHSLGLLNLMLRKPKGLPYDYVTSVGQGFNLAGLRDERRARL